MTSFTQRFRNTTRSFWIMIIVILLLFTFALLSINYKKVSTDPVTVATNPSEVSVLKKRILNLEKDLDSERKKVVDEKAENELLNKERILLLDSIQALHPVLFVETPETKTVPVARKRINPPCNCPTAFGHYRNRGTGKILTKQYCKIHGTK